MVYFERSAWGARYGRGDIITAPKHIIGVHHFAEPDVPCGVSVDFEAAIMRGVERDHVHENGWAGIGYNFVIFQSGHVYEARGWDRRGAHEEKINRVSVGIAFAMNAEKHEPTDAAREAFGELVMTGIRQGDIHQAARIMGHRDFDDTSCPGKYIYPILSDLDPRETYVD